ncbi:uncharacterized protein LOC111061860 [Nilaparvata lugens]|uniref:uncharacterized protein LOC111061860 n=1 Tax=Nilaparvata lugens TaxID=108931 RepID=UPI00193E3033|nr:uncharacterized protein LOC111061860 [Nilaparvata lugens]
MELLFSFFIVAVASILQVQGENSVNYVNDDGIQLVDVPLFTREVLGPIIELIEYYGVECVTLPYRVQTTPNRSYGKVFKIYYFNISGGPKVEMCHARIMSGARFPNVDQIVCDEFVHPEQTYYAGRSSVFNARNTAFKARSSPNSRIYGRSLYPEYNGRQLSRANQRIGMPYN